MRIAVDYDGTCVRNVWPSRSGEWLPGAVDTLRELLDQGHTILVHTCRIAPVLSNGRSRRVSAVDREIRSIRKKLDKAGLSAISIHVQPWKPPADVYLDDKAVRFVDWQKVREEFLV